MSRSTSPPVADAGLLSLEKGQADVVPGVAIFPTPGHTPGHASVRVSSGDHLAIVAGDVVLHELSFGHPDWLAASETDADIVESTRRVALEQAASDESLFVAYHVDGVGRVERDGGGAFRFVK
jgi:glyoxylase-like metal-dependent hydrolase (beta-lactamase superfamily II)